MAASESSTTRTTGLHETLTATSVDSDRSEEDRLSPFGEDVPTEEGGVVAMAGWSMAAATIGLLAIGLVITLMLRRRRRSRRAAREAASETQHAVTDFLERSRRETRRLGRRIAVHLPTDAAA